MWRGGSGAFSITLCHRFPDLRATVLDFPTVTPVAQRYITEAGLADRIGVLPGDALQSTWRLGRLAYDALRPGGQLLVHDFFVDDDRQGPRGAALWFVLFLFNPDAASLTPGGLTAALAAGGFTDVTVRDVIPGLTRLAIARKPA